MEEKDIDKYFRENLADHSETPPPSVWEGVESQLNRGGGMYRFLALLLLLLIGGFAGYFLLHDASDKVASKKSEVAQSPTHSSVEKRPEKNISVPDSEKRMTSAFAKKEQELVKETRATSPPDKKSIRENQNEDVGDQNIAVTPAGRNYSMEGESVNLENVMPFESMKNPIRTEVGKSSNKMMLQSISKMMLQSISALGPETTAIPDFTAVKKPFEYYSPQKDWHLFIFGMANYTHRRLAAEDGGGEIVQALDQRENGLIAPGAGLQISRELSPKFRLSLGIEYNEWIQEGNYTVSAVASEENVISTPTTSSESYNPNGAITSSLGNADLSFASLTNQPQELFNDAVNEVILDLNARQRISYLSIPLTAEYVMAKYPFQFLVGGGFSVNQIIGNELEIRSPEGVDVSATPPAIEGTYFSFHAGIAVEYSLSERFAVRLNPVYRGWMTPVFENENFRSLPFSLALRGGLVYRL